MKWFSKKNALRALLALVMVYLVSLAVTFYVMCQPPETVTRVMKIMPAPLKMLFLMKPLWEIARAGELEPGAIAPDFELPVEDGRSKVKLNKFRGKKPVVLVFGSYT